ncbi:PH domain protein (macronuclear) [Tetrahymena thermophila SB210]|uniref:PH domain protein n=1 Tax=Tetrahymena thermophila (strain SB210) TaxID=312017 RepID=Q24FU9_TETTS|nr:PH domain protein [Tetrahymena thermophila SB210]EAS06661.1 PH domain protein [Tetrahymena thermophila SB210]|eukprot:XP_001026906.1 PH domain protein [Tetrahymena thermophila SB210]
MQSQKKEANFINIQNIDQDYDDFPNSEEISIQSKEKNQELPSRQINQPCINANNKRMNFLKAKVIAPVDDDVFDEFQYEQDKDAKTQVSEKVLRKIENLKLETIQKNEAASGSVNNQLVQDIEYYNKIQVSSAIDLIENVGKKEIIADDLIQVQDSANNPSKNFRNAWIVNTVEKKYHNNNNNNSNTNIPQKEDQNEEVLFQGNLLKYTGGIINKWKQVRCVLKKDYFQVQIEKETSEDKQINKYLIIDSLNFKIFQITVEIVLEDNIHELVLKLLHSNYVLRLRDTSSSYQILQQWKQKIENSIKQAEGFQKYKLEEDKMPLITQNEVMMESEFIEKAKSGDIILFNTESIPAAMQRKTTFSKYDHVGIVVKLRDNFVRIFDATGYGVELTEWNKFVYENGQYNSMTYRQLNYSKREKVLPALYNFILQANGKKYSMNLLKFAKMNSIVEDNSSKNKDSTYFCSELVAKCLKEMGLLNQITSSTQYWPRSFSSEYEDKELVLYDNAFLEQEKTILLDADLYKIKSNKN